MKNACKYALSPWRHECYFSGMEYRRNNLACLEIGLRSRFESRVKTCQIDELSGDYDYGTVRPGSFESMESTETPAAPDEQTNVEGDQNIVNPPAEDGSSDDE